MSTNFYWDESLVPEDYREENGASEDNIHRHIGKRSCAGMQCPDCGIPQVKTWVDLHTSRYEGSEHEHCPGCGQNFTEMVFTFTWTMFKHRWRLEELAQEEAKRYRRLPKEDWTRQAERDGMAPVYDEYGTALSATEFLQSISDHLDLISSQEFF